MNIKLECQDEPASPTNITCPWDSCQSNVRGHCHGIPKLVKADVEEYSKDDGYLTHERLTCANYERREKKVDNCEYRNCREYLGNLMNGDEVVEMCKYGHLCSEAYGNKCEEWRKE